MISKSNENPSRAARGPAQAKLEFDVASVSQTLLLQRHSEDLPGKAAGIFTASPIAAS
jgi:hypothetical protein